MLGLAISFVYYFPWAVTTSFHDIIFQMKIEGKRMRWRKEMERIRQVGEDMKTFIHIS